MSHAPGLLLTVLAFLAVIGPLVFVHELGHYLVGRWFGVKAEAFSIGFGREMFGFTDRLGTRWKFGWLPLGGYVRFAGDMNPASQPDPKWMMLPAEERNRTFYAKPVWQRALIVAAGPITNFLLAILILAAFAMAIGVNRTPPVAGAVQPGSAAAAAGMLAGDRVVSVNGRRMSDFGDFAEYVIARPNQLLNVEVLRGERELTLSVTPKTQYRVDRFGNKYPFGRLGVASPRPVIERVGLLEAPGVAVEQTIGIVRMMIDGLGQIVTGMRSAKELGGPLRIAQFSGEAASAGAISFAYLVALISINLGFINLLPVPMLDGGHLLFYGLEAVRRKPVDPQVQEWAFRSGLLLLLGLMLFVTFNDLSAFGLLRGLSGLIG
ncbi:RIP metalloprotease RseP [Sphingomonas sp. ID1715]|uniref:RIP metalloprotease RseP n=1 Tax=Sphingomonas sp. ID1715 TaxID=1656898 RepID=UPI001488BBF3|nr:RIP metalloprotease RseP [Sphingomonas sp. ID1715]NNM75396.1 RIP metalloprotease RseP [Sphingomonas sp. ID1715]